MKHRSVLPSRRVVVGAGVALAALAVHGVFAQAPAQPASTGSGQAWPSKPISLVVPFAAGGTTETERFAKLVREAKVSID